MIAWLAADPAGAGLVVDTAALLDEWLIDIPQVMRLQPTRRSAWP